MGYKDKENQKEYQRAWHKKHYARIKLRMGVHAKQNKANVRAWFKVYKSAAKCELCVENHPACLQFHHRDPSQKRFAVSTAVSAGLAIATILQEISKCRVLCGNCHAKLHFKDVADIAQVAERWSVAPEVSASTADVRPNFQEVL